MDPTGARALALTVQFVAHGVPVTVTLCDDDSVIATTGVWLPALDEQMPVGRDYQKREPRRVLALPRLEVPRLPRGSRVVAPEYGGTVSRTWLVDGIEKMDAEQIRAVLAAVTGS